MLPLRRLEGRTPRSTHCCIRSPKKEKNQIPKEARLFPLRAHASQLHGAVRLSDHPNPPRRRPLRRATAAIPRGAPHASLRHLRLLWIGGILHVRYTLPTAPPTAAVAGSGHRRLALRLQALCACLARAAAPLSPAALPCFALRRAQARRLGEEGVIGQARPGAGAISCC
jgi:hypothetical protein